MRQTCALAAEGRAPLILDSKKPTIPVAEYIYTENCYKQLTRNNPEVAKKLADDLQKEERSYGPTDERREKFRLSSFFAYVIHLDGRP